MVESFKTIREIEAQMELIQEDLKKVQSPKIVSLINGELSHLKALHKNMSEKLKEFNFTLDPKNIVSKNDIKIASLSVERDAGIKGFGLKADIVVNGIPVSINFKDAPLNPDFSKELGLVEAAALYIDDVFNKKAK